MTQSARKPFGKKEVFATADAIRFEQDVFADEYEAADDEELLEDEFYEDEYEDEQSDGDLSRVDVDSVIALTARLAQVLAEEADLLAEMRVREIEGLQKEKMQLLEALETQKKFIDRNPELMAALSDEECLELAQIIEIFQTVMKENHRRLLIAREVNRKVVEAIKEVVQEANKNGMYDKKGLPDKTDGGVCMSLNQTI